MSETIITYETPNGIETISTEVLEYESGLDCWRFETTADEATEIVHIPRERVYELRQQRPAEEREGRDEYGHP